MDKLEPMTGVVPVNDIPKIMKRFGATIPEEIKLPFSYKLDDKHTLVLERRASLKVTDKGLVDQVNWRIHANKVNLVARDE